MYVEISTIRNTCQNFEKQTLFWLDNSVEIRLISGMCYENYLFIAIPIFMVILVLFLIFLHISSV